MSTPTTYAPGTVVRIVDEGLPSPDRDGDAQRTVLDPTVYGLVTDPQMVLIASPNGWAATVQPGQADVGFVSRVFWVTNANVRSAWNAPVDDVTLAESKRNHTAAAEQRDAMAALLDQTKASLRTESNDHQAFRALVRAVAIRVAGDQDWCDEGLNGVLDELGLDRKAADYDVEVEVSLTITRTVTVRVEGVSGELAAQDEMSHGLIEETLREQGDWPDGDDVQVDDYTVESCTEAD